MSKSDHYSSRPKRQFNNTYTKDAVPAEQAIACGLGSSVQYSFPIPEYLKGNLGCIGGQQSASPFEQISRKDWRIRRNNRRDFLEKVDKD